MKQSVEFGEVAFQEEILLIKDNEKYSRNLQYIFGAILALMGVVHFLNWNKGGQELGYSEYIYAAIVLIGIGLILNRFRFTAKSEVNYSEIKRVKFVERFGRGWHDIYLEGKIRRVMSSPAFGRTLEQKIASSKH